MRRGQLQVKTAKYLKNPGKSAIMFQQKADVELSTISFPQPAVLNGTAGCAFVRFVHKISNINMHGKRAEIHGSQSDVGTGV